MLEVYNSGTLHLILGQKKPEVIFPVFRKDFELLGSRVKSENFNYRTVRGKKLIAGLRYQ